MYIFWFTGQIIPGIIIADNNTGYHMSCQICWPYNDQPLFIFSITNSQQVSACEFWPTTNIGPSCKIFSVKIAYAWVIFSSTMFSEINFMIFAGAC